MFIFLFPLIKEIMGFHWPFLLSKSWNIFCFLVIGFCLGWATGRTDSTSCSHSPHSKEKWWLWEKWWDLRCCKCTHFIWGAFSCCLLNMFLAVHWLLYEITLFTWKRCKAIFSEQLPTWHACSRFVIKAHRQRLSRNHAFRSWLILGHITQCIRGCLFAGIYIWKLGLVHFCYTCTRLSMQIHACGV